MSTFDGQFVDITYILKPDFQRSCTFRFTEPCAARHRKIFCGALYAYMPFGYYVSYVLIRQAEKNGKNYTNNDKNFRFFGEVDNK